MKANIQEVDTLVQDYFISNWYSEDTALWMTDNLIEAELFWKATHGLVRVPWILSNKIPDSHLSNEDIQLQPNAVNLIDSTNQNGYLSCDHVVDEMIKLLDKDDCKFVVSVLKSAFPSSILLRYLKRFYEHRLMALVLGTTPRLVSDADQVPNIFWTNPIGYTLPLQDNRALLADFSTSDIPLWKVLMVHQGDKKVLQKWRLLDRDWKITDSTHNAFWKDGKFLWSLLPFWWEDGIHKWMMISLFIEIISAYLSWNRSDKGDLVLVWAKADLVAGWQEWIAKLLTWATDRWGLKRLPWEVSMQNYYRNRESWLITVPDNVAKLIWL